MGSMRGAKGGRIPFLSAADRIILIDFGMVIILGGAFVFFVVNNLCVPHRPYIPVDLQAIIHSAEMFQVEMGRYLTTIEEMSESTAKETGRDWSIENRPDPWGRPFIYKLIDGKPHVYCFGRDGLPGGTGADRDYEWPESEAPK